MNIIHQFIICSLVGYDEKRYEPKMMCESKKVIKKDSNSHISTELLKHDKSDCIEKVISKISF